MLYSMQDIRFLKIPNAKYKKREQSVENIEKDDVIKNKHFSR